MAEPLSILFVGGHPHDVIAQAGGTLALHARRGDRVIAAVLTHGGATHTARYRDDTDRGAVVLSEGNLSKAAGAMEGEIREAAGVLGITDVRFLHTRDDIVLLDIELIRALEDVIREVRPDIIVTHHPLAEAGIGSTHATAGQLVLHACTAADSLRPDHPRPAWRVAQIFFITPPQGTTLLDSTIPRTPIVFVDVAEVMALKMQAEQKVTAQYRGETARKKHECMEGYWGIQVGLPYCEVFTPYHPEIFAALPLGSYLRERASASHHERAKRAAKILL
jgi:LmbE family N-acetylglucosaminyl deacetylase